LTADVNFVFLNPLPRLQRLDIDKVDRTVRPAVDGADDDLAVVGLSDLLRPCLSK
jgi:hypothetical protein